MDGMTILAVVVLLYGALCLALALFKAPAAIWNMGKIEGFKKLFGEVGTQVFLGAWGAVGVALGVWLLVRQALTGDGSTLVNRVRSGDAARVRRRRGARC